MQAVSDRIILIPDPVQDKIGDVLIPDTSLKKPQKGVVISVGPDCKEVKIGYEVMFLQGDGVSFNENGIEKLIIREQSVLGYSSDDAPGDLPA